MKIRFPLHGSRHFPLIAVFILVSAFSSGCLQQQTATLEPGRQERLESVEWRMVSLEANFLEYKEQIRNQEERIRNLESRMAGQAPGAGMPEDVMVFEEEEVFIQPSPGAPAIRPAPKAPTAQLAAPSGSPYNRAMAAYKAGRFAEARKKFQQYSESAPSSKLAPNALYWVGETWYSQNNFAQAILSFKEVTRRYPKSSKAPAALLKIAYSYEKLKDTDNAKFYLKALLDEYPKSGPASKARSMLKALGG